MYFVPKVYELGQIHAAAYAGLVPNVLLAYQDKGAASLQLTQENCIVLDCFQALRGPIDAIYDYLQSREDFWRLARIETKIIPADPSRSQPIGLAVMPYHFQTGKYIRVSLLHRSPQLLIEANNFSQRMIFTANNRLNFVKKVAFALTRPLVVPVTQD